MSAGRQPALLISTRSNRTRLLFFLFSNSMRLKEVSPVNPSSFGRSVGHASTSDFWNSTVLVVAHVEVSKEHNVFRRAHRTQHPVYLARAQPRGSPAAFQMDRTDVQCAPVHRQLGLQ